MRFRSVLVALLFISATIVAAPASWANSLTFQNVTFNLSLNGGNLDLRVTNALNANGDWQGIDSLKAFHINNFGTASGLTATGGGVTWGTVLGGLSAGGAGGCNGNGGGTCFSASPFLTLTNDFTLSVAKTSGAFNLTLPDDKGVPGPHLKVFFQGADQGGGHGNLLSLTIPANGVPGPDTLMLLGGGLAGLVIWRRKATTV